MLKIQAAVSYFSKPFKNLSQQSVRTMVLQWPVDTVVMGGLQLLRVKKI